jgi:transposase-like protein
MRAKNEKRISAEKLRRDDGLSYSEISELIGVSKSTLSSWLKQISLSSEQQEILKNKMDANRDSFAARALIVNRERFINSRMQAQHEGSNLIEKLPKDHSIGELALAMLYVGEGSKSYGRVQIANTDPGILRYFLSALILLYDIDESRLSFRLNIVDIARLYEKEYIDWWKNEIRYPNGRFLKTQFDIRSRAQVITPGYHGVCTITYCDTYLQQKILSIAYSYIALCHQRN